MHLLGINLCQQTKIANHHQSLNMVCIARIQGLPNRLSEAIHVDLTIPKPLGKFCGMSHFIVVDITWHSSPVNTPHKFSPTQNLPHEPFNT